MIVQVHTFWYKLCNTTLKLNKPLYFTHNILRYIFLSLLTVEDDTTDDVRFKTNIVK